MCVAVPGKILSIDQGTALVDFDGNTVPAALGLVDARVGDWVLVHAGCVLQVLSEEEGDSLRELFAELADVMGEDAQNG